MGSVKVKIGGREFKLDPMTFGQIERVVPLVARLSGAGTERVAILLDIMQIMISEAYPAVDIRKLPFDRDGLQNAYDEVLSISGLVQKVAVEPGEAPARAKRSTSRKSAPA